KGQSLLELALFFPILLILLSGVVEFGLFLNQYLSIQDAARNAARFASDGLYDRVDNIKDCNATRDFYRQAACVVNQELVQEQPWITMERGFPYNTPVDCETNPSDSCCTNRMCLHLDPERVDNDGVLVGDDIVISVFGVTDGQVTARFPDTDGWSFAEDWGIGVVKSSSFTNSDVNNLLLDPGSPSTGYILVEVYYHYDQALNLPWVEAFIPDPIATHTYAFMPLSSAEPTPTPLP
ncbi:MAG: hypothetical protein GWO08_14450, partial [Gammaproteobacteria bacterium]|nr:hypothetical protein [candidate division Zixibacteria bacterium]NIR94817.1 hypothetical protein [Gammaproteobacteria bacterium]NIS45053.1 hypothetical protein [candidate division Zixibacteria bacterium]NIU13162.1 hypothetical protein [candidate division Zixibacteria bacterium]NIV05210.1 hypothetical protein [candidate division Zixibacteria bacterium]